MGGQSVGSKGVEGPTVITCNDNFEIMGGGGGSETQNSVLHPCLTHWTGQRWALFAYYRPNRSIDDAIALNNLKR